MRTKHILTALALPVVFAACTADDIVKESVGQAERVALNENFKLNIGGVESRLSAGEPDGEFTFDFEKNDTVGGAIVDAFNADGELEVVNYVSTNHPFVNEGTKWSIKHTMVEGSYLFYYPYNQKNNSRSAVVYEIPVMQDLSDAEGKFNRKAAIEKYTTAVGLVELEKTDLHASVNLNPINSYARIVAKFDNRYAGGEVEKVVLQTTEGDEFTVKGQISNIKLADIQEDVLEGDKKWADVKTLAELSIASDEAFYNKPEEITGRTSTVLVGKVPAGVKMKVDAQNNKSFETYMVVPAQSLTHAVKVYLYLTDGRVFVGATKSGITFNRHTPKKVEVEMDEADEVPFVITSMKDWNLYASEVSKNTTAVFEIANPDFVLTNDAKFPTAAGATIKVTTDLTIAGDDVTMKNVIATGKIIVNEGAKLTTDATLVADAIENYGEVVVAPVKDEEGDYVEYNLGGYNYTKEDKTYTVSSVNKPESVSSFILNGSTITNKPGATLEIAENAIVRTKIVNDINTKDEAMTHGTVTVNGTAVLIDGSENAGKVVNNGSMTGTFTNKAKMPYDKNAITFEEVEDYIYFTPSVENNGEIFANKAWTNNGLINNAKGAEISVSKVDDGAAFTNNGTIKLADGSFCLITTNAVNAEIVLSVLNQENWSANSNSGVVAYTTGAADAGKTYDFTTTGKNITKIYLNGSLGITKVGKVNDIVVESDATISMPKEGTIANLTVKSGVAAAVKSVTDADGTINAANFTTVIVEKGATLTVNEGNKLACTTVSNEGTVYVGGTFDASGTLAAEAGKGKFKTTSTGANITFGGQTDDQKKEAAYKTALAEYVNTWIENANTSEVTAWTVVETKLADNLPSVEAVLIKANAMVDKYNAWKGTNKNYSTTDVLAVVNYNEGSYLKATVASLKTAADATVKAAIKAKVKDNSWIGSSAYVKAESDADFSEIKNGEAALYNGYATYLNTLKWDIKEVTDTEAKEYEVTVQTWLSIKGITAARYYGKASTTATEDTDLNADEIPAYSYINVYEGSDEYKAMKLWYEITGGNYDNAGWYVEFKANINKPSTAQPTKLDAFRKFFNEAYKVAVSDKYEDDLEAQKVLGDVKTLAPSIINNWKYTNEQIIALEIAYNASVGNN